MYLFALLPLAAVLSSAAVSCGGDDDGDKPAGDPTEKPSTAAWHVAWREDFNGSQLDANVWSRIPEGTPDWQKYQSADDRCYELADGVLTLKGIVNDDLQADARPYLCGGVWTKDKKSLSIGDTKGLKVAVRARMAKQSRGAWPAIWMMPFSTTSGWPACGEVDIMEHLNYDQSVYQTLHSDWIDNLGHKTDPQYSCQPSVNPAEWTTYEVFIFADRTVFRINGRETLTYPNLGKGLSQYPFFQAWDLRLDMQLGGSWVGQITPSTLPSTLEIDWVEVSNYY